MTQGEITDKLKGQFNDRPPRPSPVNADSLEIERDQIVEVAHYLRDDEELAFDFLICLFGADYLTHLELIYIFHSYAKNHQLIVRTRIEREEPAIQSISGIYPGANWHEREAYDLFGIRFTDHPDLRRILLPDDWEGYPMRKDFTHENLVRRPEND
jgi:NADH-quinone oxidoreductase subunit C